MEVIVEIEYIQYSVVCTTYVKNNLQEVYEKSFPTSFIHSVLIREENTFRVVSLQIPQVRRGTPRNLTFTGLYHPHEYSNGIPLMEELESLGKSRDSSKDSNERDYPIRILVRTVNPVHDDHELYSAIGAL